MIGSATPNCLQPIPTWNDHDSPTELSGFLGRARSASMYSRPMTMRRVQSTRKADGMSETYLALLRAVNVGGKNKLPMKVLVEICNEAGCKNVRTFIQSGNVIFDATSRAQA